MSDFDPSDYAARFTGDNDPNNETIEFGGWLSRYRNSPKGHVILEIAVPKIDRDKVLQMDDWDGLIRFRAEPEGSVSVDNELEELLRNFGE